MARAWHGKRDIGDRETCEKGRGGAGKSTVCMYR
jgi:hypothetical protein